MFIDEADALLGKRAETKDAHDRYANVEVAFLLQKMEDHDGVVIIATNLAHNIDAAFSRRMQFVLQFPLPDTESRERLWQAMFPPQAPRAKDLDISFLARQFEFAGGDIRNMTFGSIGEFLVPTPVGNILVQAGNGSGQGQFAGRGGIIDGINGAVGSVPIGGFAAGVIQTTKLLAGHGGGGADVTKSGKGGTVSNVSLSRGGGAGIVLTIQAGDAGDTPTAKNGANGGNVSTIGVGNIDDQTIVRRKLR